MVQNRANESVATDMAIDGWRLTFPLRQILLMIIFLVSVAIIGWWLYQPIHRVFLANPYLNGLIIAVFAVGVISAFLQHFSLFSAIRWLNNYVSARPGHEFVSAPRLVAPISALMRDQQTRTALTAQSMRSLLDAVGDRLREDSDLTSYIRGLLIFLGLLGTFWGLSISIPAVIDTIRNLAPSEGESDLSVFAQLIGGLEDQLGGMATAFASSLLGLSGSMIVGFLELQTGHAQGRFYRELEEWLSLRTWLTGGQDEGGREAFLASVLDRFSQKVESFSSLMETLERQRKDADKYIASALKKLESNISSAAAKDSESLAKVVQGQDKLIALMQARAEMDPAIDEETRRHIRNIDIQILRAIEEIVGGREDMTAALRSEIQRIQYLLEKALESEEEE